MKTLIIFGHPQIDNSRFSKALLGLAEKSGLSTRVLAKQQTQPYHFDVAAEQALIKAHDRIIFVFPMQWYDAPALLNKYFEDVFTFEFAYNYTEGGKLKGKQFMCVLSTGGPESAYHLGGMNNATADDYLLRFERACSFCAMQYLPAYIFYGNNPQFADQSVVEDHAQKALKAIQA
jgi:glutathione-regulated potassium-efflux system ancillary protein KefG